MTLTDDITAQLAASNDPRALAALAILTGKKLTKTGQCLVEECTARPRGLGYCKPHYMRYRRTGDPLPQKTPQPPVCTVNDCDEPSKSHGLCKVHYHRWHRTGTTDPSRAPGGQTCAVEGCDDPARGRGYCKPHYARDIRTGSPTGTARLTQAERFEKFVERTGDCWLWTGKPLASGYGRFTPDRSDGVPVHRYAYEQAVGPIPAGHGVAHTCHDDDCVGPCAHRLCVNPAHLTLKVKTKNVEPAPPKAVAPLTITRRPDPHPVPCVDHPELFCGPNGELKGPRREREEAAVRLCRTGGPGGGPCPLLGQCAIETDADDRWTVRAGLTPADRGHTTTWRKQVAA